jgi:acetolactate synthase-1/2/3 large subunit
VTRTSAHLLVETLASHGVSRAFCVPGESYLAVMNVLYDDPVFEMVPCRHEGGACFMAVADGKLTGRPGICFASRGPGATNAAIAVHTAQQDAVPLILFLGQVPRDKIGRGAFQEVDYKRSFSDMAKWVEEVQRPERLPEAIARAFQKAMTGTPGPVVVSMPTDMLPEATDGVAMAPRPTVAPHPAADDVAAVAERLATAKRPLMIVGSGVRPADARAALAAVSEAWGVAVMTTFENQDVFTHAHPNFAGELGIRPPAPIRQTAEAADLVLAVGTRLTDMSTQGYAIPTPDQRLVHVYPDASQIGHVFQTELGVVADAGAFLSALASHNAPPAPKGRADWLARAHQAQANTTRFEPRPADDGIDFGLVVNALGELAGDDAIITSDAGSFASWLHKYFPFRSSHTYLGAASGAMGFGVPAAVAAALRHPDRQVIAFVGDGGALMTGSELATAMRQQANLTIIVANNANYGTIRFHQETRYPGRPLVTDLANPDFAAWGRAFGAEGLTIDTADAVHPVLTQALNSDRACVIDVHTSLENITAATTIAALREK